MIDSTKYSLQRGQKWGIVAVVHNSYMFGLRLFASAKKMVRLYVSASDIG